MTASPQDSAARLKPHANREVPATLAEGFPTPAPRGSFGTPIPQPAVKAEGTARQEPVKTVERRGQRKKREDDGVEDPQDLDGLAALLGQSVQALTVKPQHSDRKVLEEFERKQLDAAAKTAGLDDRQASGIVKGAKSSGSRVAKRGPAGSGARSNSRRPAASGTVAAPSASRIRDAMSGSSTQNRANASASQLTRVPRLLPTWSDKEEDILYLVTEETTVGRGPDNTLCIPDKMMSKKHAVFLWDGVKVTARDLGSKNGIYVNSKKVPEQVLEPGDKVVVGSRHFKFEMPKGKTVKPKSVEKKSAKEAVEETEARKTPRPVEPAPAPEAESDSPKKEGKAAGVKKIDYADKVSLSPAEAKIKMLKLYFMISMFSFGSLLLILVIVYILFKANL